MRLRKSANGQQILSSIKEIVAEFINDANQKDWDSVLTIVHYIFITFNGFLYSSLSSKIPNSLSGFNKSAA